MGSGVGPGMERSIRATRTDRPPRLDGRLEDPVWSLAEPFDRFVQNFPEEGAAPSQATVVRVLYDDRYLYVGVVCRDAHPELVLRPLGRRDKMPYSDTVSIAIDSSHDHRTAYSFTLNAGGVQADGIYYEDDTYTSTWDAVWDGAVAMRADGWSAEFVLPLSTLLFGEEPEQAWGFGVWREIGRTHEMDATVPIPRNARGLVSRLGHLTGLGALARASDVQLVPYAAAKLVLRPQYQYSDPSRADPRILDPILDMGLDLRWAPSRSTVLYATVNPDFGQVEADEIVQNLTTYELFFPEKRPFFNQGLDLFVPVGFTDEQRVPQQLFYSRRIGLETPIFGAAKLTGRISDSLQVGLLDALVAGAGQPPGSSEASPDRSVHFHWAQPLRVAPTDSFPLAAPATENYFAGVARWRATGSTTLGAMLTSAIPMAAACTEADLQSSPTPGRCLASGGHAAALDWNLRSPDSEWTFYGQVDGSQVAGGPPEQILPDATVLRPGDLGAGLYAALKRQGGEPWRFDLTYEYESPRLDLNASGYLRSQNLQMVALALRYVRPNGGGPFLNWEIDLHGQVASTTDGRALGRGTVVWLSGDVRLRDFTVLGCDLGVKDPRYDVREIVYSGIPYQKLPFLFSDCWISTDQSRAFAAEATVNVGRYLSRGPLAASGYASLDGTLVVRPHPHFETRLGLHLERSTYPGKYIPGAYPDPSLLGFGDLVSPVLSLILRQLVVLTPRLTLQLYAQIYTDSGEFERYWQAPATTGAPIGPDDLQPGPAPTSNPDFHHSALNINFVVRWEYRLGSILFLVYTRSQQELPWPGPDSPPTDLWPRALGPGPTTDSVMVKWSYWWNP
jgi:hypothetical protein